MSMYIHNCPKCMKLSRHRNEQVRKMSNSDVYTDDTYLNTKYLFVRCPYCYNIMNVNKTHIYHSKPLPHPIIKTKYHPNSQAICIRLNLMEYYELLDSEELSLEEEKNIRSHILLLENNKRRNGYHKDYEIEYNKREIDNFISLNELLSEDDLVKVEINRYLKKFDNALDLLTKHDKNHVFYTDLLIKQEELIKEENIYVSTYYFSDAIKERIKKIRF